MNNDREQLAYGAKRYFYIFVRMAFHTLYPGSKFVPGWYVEALCWALQQSEAGETPRLLITAPPRSLKSFCSAVCLAAWALGRDPTLKIIVATYGDSLSTAHARSLRTLIRSPEYLEIFPHMAMLGRDTETEIITAAGGGVRMVSLDGALTGFGADMIITDDLMKAGESWSELRRQKLRDFFELTLFSRLNEKQTGRIIAVQQRLHEDDFAAYLIDKGTFKHLNLPAIAEQDEVIELSRRRTHQRSCGDVLCPERESRATLEAIRLDMGPYAFSAQYLQNPVPPGGNRIRWDWFDTCDSVPERNELQVVVQSWDTALTAEPTSDYSVCTTWGLLDGKWYLLDRYRGRLEFPDLRRMAEVLRRRWKADKVIVEDASSGPSLVQQLREDIGPYFVTFRPDGNKEVRVAAQSGRLEGGSFFVPADAPWLPSFRHEIEAFPNGRYDDQLDSLTLFVEWQGSPWGRGWLERQLNGGRPRGSRRRQQNGDDGPPSPSRPRGERRGRLNLRRYLEDRLQSGGPHHTVYLGVDGKGPRRL